jgi:hypothetical protein
VFENLHNVAFFEIVDKLYARILIGKTYYETCEFEPLLNYIDASLRFLADNKSISKIRRIPYANFFNSLKKIIYIEEHSDWDSIPLLKKELSHIQNIENRKWLLEKLEGLEHS